MTFMHETEEKEMRQVFADTMDQLASEDRRIMYLDCDIINSISMTGFSHRHPEQTCNCGIQEANMISAAAGMSAMGLIPYAHSFAPFVTRRVMDQLFMSVAYAKLNVRVIGSDPGITAGSNGGTHIPFEDLGVMRSIPHSIVLEPADSAALRSLLIQARDIYGLTYIRLSRKKAVHIYEENQQFEIGKGIVLREGKDAGIIASGICVDDSLKAAEILAEKGIQVSVADMFTIKPVDKELVERFSRTGAIVTVENHNVFNGLGSAVCEAASEASPCLIRRLGSQDQFGEVGTVDYLKEKIHIRPEDIAGAVMETIRKRDQFHH